MGKRKDNFLELPVQIAFIIVDNYKLSLVNEASGAGFCFCFCPQKKITVLSSKLFHNYSDVYVQCVVVVVVNESG